MTFKAICFAAAAAATIGTAADAAVVYATGVTWANNGTVGSSNDRDVATNALGSPDDKFLSLGLGGDATLTFGKTFKAGTVEIAEATFGREGYTAIGDESIDVFAGIGGSLSFVGSISAMGLDETFKFVELDVPFAFNTVKLVDTSAALPGRDGFDLESIGVTPIPLPASALLLGAGLAGIGAVRRKA